MTTRFPTDSERQKRAHLQSMLEDGLVFIHLDARPAEVDVPAHLKGELALTLSVSRRFGLDVLELGPLALKASLSFGGVRHLCVIPWANVFAFTAQATERREVFPEDMPLELRQALAQAQSDERSGDEIPDDESLDESEGSEDLSVADLEANASEDEPPPEDPPPSGPRLRLVK